jgi:hypothetical protein
MELSFNLLLLLFEFVYQPSIYCIARLRQEYIDLVREHRKVVSEGQTFNCGQKKVLLNDPLKKKRSKHLDLVFPN